MKKLFAYGTKHIAPRVDTIVDVQHLNNPTLHYKETGLHVGVRQEIVNSSSTQSIVTAQADILYALYKYERVGVRCSGGRHRSVFAAFDAVQNFNGQVELLFVHPGVNYMWELIAQYGQQQAEIMYKASQFYK